MKRLTLLRHAKSGWDDSVTRDFDRPLNPKGHRAARTMGEHLRREGATFDRVVASPAVRVMETLAEVADGYGSALAPQFDRRAYLASASSLLDIVRETPDTVETLLLAGHNPGLAELALLLVPEDESIVRDTIEDKYPTAGLATIALDVPSWEACEAGSGELLSFVRPRDLDPSLGPDPE
jgi:phosphohistidine phosphatase